MNFFSIIPVAQDYPFVNFLHFILYVIEKYCNLSCTQDKIRKNFL